jgi:DNA-binding transcriptional LysR family regulator
MDIELRLLRSFVAIYERGSLSRAADRLACTQAAMSMRLKMLETEIGGRLFLRRHRGLEPTAQGSELYAKALGVLAAYDEMISTTRRGAAQPKLRIGVPDDYALGILGPVLRDLGRAPGAAERAAELEIVCDLSANLMAALQRQDIDIALVTLAAPPAARTLSVEARLDWVHHRDFRPAAGEPVGLAAYPEGCVFRGRMIAGLEAAGRPWRVLAQSRSHAGIMAAVRAGAAVTAMARGTAPADLTATAETDRLPGLAPVPIHLVSHGRAASPAARRLEEAMRRALGRAYAAA